MHCGVPDTAKNNICMNFGKRLFVFRTERKRLKSWQKGAETK